MLVTRVSKFAASVVFAVAALAVSASAVEFSGNVADGAGTVQVGSTPTATATPHPNASPQGDVTWGG
ncbi:hypothetical protein K353_04104 [Kitasatospora sp. SolWspMP-SS2h]|uniref:hypothetical protein n=1 Tax=Kitasatospora sp. SolWspMP-SS2h TaxID=1305729 RepID=UPI000DB9FC6F|nr:hypothetical protein [Kitasatospora sp. SolWspMP-SS2h]RAJ38553.1 hypothetical protein K353_04104 [Kitasatospora sp. SolWspMP-SS2h]